MQLHPNLLFAGTTVKITKLRANPDALVPAGNWNDCRAGATDNPDSLPVDYEMCGVLAADVKVGKRIGLYRFYRNGVRSDGFFVSSPVVRISGMEIHTMNSVYLVSEP
jgi:hypothetical protein